MIPPERSANFTARWRDRVREGVRHNSVDQIDWAIDLGYSAIGVVLHPSSPRYCGADRAKDLAEYARGRITTVAVGLTYDEVTACGTISIMCRSYEYRDLDRYIYAGDTEPPCRSPSAVHVRREQGLGEAAQVFRHGSMACRERLIISGGLAPDNVSAIIRGIPPFRG